MLRVLRCFALVSDISGGEKINVKCGNEMGIFKCSMGFCLFCHRVALCCSPGEEEAVQSGDLWMPLVSQDGHAMTHALALT